MSELLLLRHAETLGTLQKRYVGRTDNPLCDEGRKNAYEMAAALPGRTGWPASVFSTANAPGDGTAQNECLPFVFVSPKKRCLETAALAFSGVPKIEIDDFRECDFGAFENKTFEELQHVPAYQRWLKSGGETAIPGGENKTDFCIRVYAGFLTALDQCKELERAAFVVHGGTIMALLERYCTPRRPYFKWHVENCHGFLVQLEKTAPTPVLRLLREV